MRVAIDAHALGSGVGGNETFVRQLLRGLREVAPQTDITAYVQPGLEDAAELASGFPIHELSARSSWMRVPFALPKAVRDTKADLLHVQYIAPPRCPCPFVVTLHDMVWKQFPETLRKVDRWRLAALVPGTLRRAARVFVVTHAMKREAQELYGVPEDKLDVVPNAVDPRFEPEMDDAVLAAVCERYGLHGPYIAFLGNLQPRKNVARLARAFKLLVDRGFPHSLVCIGSRSWLYGEIAQQIDRLALGDRLVFTGYVPGEDLPAILSAAEAFAYVSLYEGFGLPVAEAMACGVPVLTSTDSALAEVGGDGALRCDPLDVEAIAEALETLLTDGDLRARLRGAGLERAATYTPAAMARAALAGYRAALGVE